MKYLLIIAVISVHFIATQSQELEPEWPECDPDRVTWHPHPYACTRYVLCFHGNPIERLCAPGLHFSRFYELCMFPQLAMCDINYSCPNEDDEFNPVFLPDENDCSSYFVCFNGNAISRDCYSGLWWDVVYNWCTIDEEVTCDSRVPNDPRPPPTPTLGPTEPTESTTQPTTTQTITTTTEPPTDPTTEPTTSTTTTTTTTQDPNTYDCPLGSDPTFHPHSRECDLYFICINGIAFLRQCAPEMWFDIIERECNDRAIATCISGTNSTDPDLNFVNKLPESYSFVCPLHFDYDILLFPHQSKCDQYYLCEKGVAYLHLCPRGEFYDIRQEKCGDPTTAVCLKNL